MNLSYSSDSDVFDSYLCMDELCVQSQSSDESLQLYQTVVKGEDGNEQVN